MPLGLALPHGPAVHSAFLGLEVSEPHGDMVMLAHSVREMAQSQRREKAFGGTRALGGTKPQGRCSEMF